MITAFFSIVGLEYILRWLYLLSMTVWIGSLYFTNLVQISCLKEIKSDVRMVAQTKLLSKMISWLGWSAMFCFVAGWSIVGLRVATTGFVILKTSWGTSILIASLLGLMILSNIWYLIWPYRKNNIASVFEDERSTIVNRHNILFSIPFLFFSATDGHFPFQGKSAGWFVWIVIFLIFGALEFNALKGKLGPLSPMKRLICGGVGLTLVLCLIVGLLG